MSLAPFSEGVSAGPLQPAHSVDALVEQFQGQTRAIVEAVATNPFMGIAVVCPMGMILYMNDMSAQTLGGPTRRPEDFVGRALREVFTPAWADERLTIIRDAVLTGRPMLVRTLWYGLQIMTWFRSLTPADAEPGRRAVIAMAHRVVGDAAEWFDPNTGDYVESRGVRLGPLDKLTTPELRVLALLGRGMSVREVSEKLFRAEKTIEFHRTSIHRKLKIADRVQLACIAQKAGLTLADADRPRM